MNSKYSWENIQKQSDEILSGGLFLLKSKPFLDFKDVINKDFGNYLITLDKKSFYIGEAKELSKRIRQQARPTTSTFYKSFQKALKLNLLIKQTNIDSFKVQTISTNIGRKEVEEFGIVNLPTILNRFQLDKRQKHKIDDKRALWKTVQKNYEEILKEGEIHILESTFTHWDDIKNISKAGLYVVKDKLGKIIYIGESSNVGARISTHSKQTYFSALRRHIGTDILCFELHEIKGKRRYFNETEDRKVTEFLNTCKVTLFPVAFGRYELEEYLIKKHRPLLNRKDNKD